MRIQLPTKILVEAVAHAASVAANKSPKPILECLALRADSGTGVSLEATDLDVGIRYRLSDAQVSEEGTLVIPASRLLSVVREVDETETTLVEEEGGLSVDTGRSHFRVRGEAAEEFAQLPYFPKTGAFSIPADTLRTLIRRTAFATAKEAGRFALHGVLVRITGDQIEMVATDGRRLARMTSTLPKAAEKDVQAIIGPKGLQLLERLLDEDAGDVDVAIQDRQVLFRSGRALIISRLIDGSFPSMDGVIPKKCPHQFTATVADLAAGLRRASLLTTRDALSVELSIQPGALLIRSRAQDVGEAKVEVPIQYDGKTLQIGFNPLFLQDALKVMDPAAEVRFEFADAKSPGKMTDREDFTYVVMPIALE